MKLFAYIRSYIQWVLFGLTLACAVMTILVLGSFLKPPRLEALLRLLSKTMVKISMIDLHVHGLENLDRSKTYIVMFNHFNFLDHFVIYHVLKIHVRGLEKESHFEWPVYGKFLKLIDAIPIASRGNTESAIRSLEIAKEKIKSGVSMFVAPEGTRSLDGKLGPFKKGGFYMAIQTQTEILPIVFLGMERFNLKHQKLLNPCRVDLFIDKPISTKGMTDQDATKLRDHVRDVYENYYE